MSKLATKLIAITNALKHTDNARGFALYRPMRKADELEARNYVQNLVSCCERKAAGPLPVVEAQPLMQPEKRSRKKEEVMVSSLSCEEMKSQHASRAAPASLAPIDPACSP